MNQSNPSIEAHNLKTQGLRILVTGAAGALAQLIVARLSAEHQVVTVDFRKREDFGPSIPSYQVDFHKRGFEDVFRNHPFDGVIHLGRFLAHESNRQGRYNANVLGTQNLLNLCLKYNIPRVVVLSTYFVYGAHAYNPAQLDETAPLKASNLTMDLVDSVELENLANLYMWKHRELAITILRPCNIAGPKVRNSMSLLLSSRVSPVLLGFSPLMQFIHVEDMADAVSAAFLQNRPGIYNVAPQDWIAYQDALAQCGCVRFPIASVPPIIPRQISKLLGLKAFPSFLVDYFKYPVVLDSSLFFKTFDFQIKKPMREIFSYYRAKKPKVKGFPLAL